MPSLAELRKQIKEEQEKEKTNEITKGGKVAQPKKPNVPESGILEKKISKKTDVAPGATMDKKLIPDIDHKINEIVNERLLKLVSLGLKHELTIENMIQYFKETRKLKLYNLTRYFSDAKPGEVNNVLQYLYKTGVLTRDKNNWYSLK